MIRLLIIILTLASATRAQSLPESPCGGVFEYEPLGTEPGRWYGVIHLFTSTPLRSLWLNIELDSKAELLGNWIGDVTSKDNMNYKIENTHMMIKPGAPLDVRIFVQYNVLNKAPKLQSIKFNGREICNAGTFVSPDNTPPTQSTTETTKIFTIPPQSPTPPVQPPSEGTPDIVVKGSEVQCGRVINEIPLVVLGTRALEGQWPWQIALYETKIADSKFICGGTLLSHRHVITAAHCTTHEHSRRLKNINSLIVFLGKHNLQTTTYRVQIRFVEQVLVHPEYDPAIYYHDISIITLMETVSYTNRVQPACLWPENLIPLSNIIGKKGSVVGWGYDRTGVLTEELNLVEMQVVSTETCLRSKNEFYNRFTSNYTFCAGNNDGSSVCNGDSGGGMVFKLDDGSWYLRGIVSLSVATPNDNRCDPNSYVIFTDVAQLLPWIKSNVFDY